MSRFNRSSTPLCGWHGVTYIVVIFTVGYKAMVHSKGLLYLKMIKGALSPGASDISVDIRRVDGVRLV